MRCWPLRRGCRRCAGGRRASDGDGFATNVFVAGQQAARRHDVNWHPEQLPELVFDMQEIEETAAVVKLHQEVDVARLGVVAPSERTEEIDPFASIGEHDAANVVALCINQLPLCTHNARVPRGCSGSGGGGGNLKA